MSQQNMGSLQVFTTTLGIKFADGTQQNTSAGFAVAPLAGVLVCTGATATYNFANNYVGNSAPIVVITALDGLENSGKQWGVSINGSPGAWTGFTINVSGSVFGAFNYVVFGNPN